MHSFMVLYGFAWSILFISQFVWSMQLHTFCSCFRLIRAPYQSWEKGSGYAAQNGFFGRQKCPHVFFSSWKTLFLLLQSIRDYCQGLSCLSEIVGRSILVKKELLVWFTPFNKELWARVLQSITAFPLISIFFQKNTAKRNMSSAV